MKSRIQRLALTVAGLGCVAGVALAAAQNCPDTVGHTKIPGDPPPPEAVGKWQGVSAFGKLELTGMKDDAIVAIDMGHDVKTFDVAVDAEGKVSGSGKAIYRMNVAGGARFNPVPVPIGARATLVGGTQSMPFKVEGRVCTDGSTRLWTDTLGSLRLDNAGTVQDTGAWAIFPPGPDRTIPPEEPRVLQQAGLLGIKDRIIVSFAKVTRNPSDARIMRMGWDAKMACDRSSPAGTLTVERLQAIMPRLSATKAAQYTPLLQRAIAEQKIDTIGRQVAFLAQLSHESNDLATWQEQADGSNSEGRKDLCNTNPGDGPRYKGRGPIQLTGRCNYRDAGKALGLNLEGNPDLVLEPATGFRVAAWFWALDKLNTLADDVDACRTWSKGSYAGSYCGFHGTTRDINGGFNGLTDRDRRYTLMLKEYCPELR